MTLAAPTLEFDPTLVREGIVFMVALIVSIGVHEYAHARTADWLGDTLPRSQGRVTLNPIAHLDLWGTLLFPLLMFVGSAAGVGLRLLGWGKPVQVSRTVRYRHGVGDRAGHLMIALAGPGSNLAFGLVLSVLFVALRAAGLLLAASIVKAFIVMNIGLAFFNLFPCPPLDGGELLVAVLPAGHPVRRFVEKYGFMVFFALFFTGALAFLMLPATALGSAWLARLVAWSR